MKKKLMFMFFLAGVMIITASCSAQTKGFKVFGAGPGSQEANEGGEPFTSTAHKGNYGLEMAFGKNQPPREVYYTGGTSRFNTLIELRNRGAFTISEGYMYLSGFDKNIIDASAFWQGPDNRRTLGTLEGASTFLPEGGYDVIEYESTITSNFPSNADSYDPILRATVCYKYETHATPMVCIDPNPFSALEEDKVCKVRDASVAGGQGAPVAVTLVEEEATEQFVHFKIHIANVDTKGTVYLEEMVDDRCPFDLGYSDLNKVRYSVSLGNDWAPDSCKPDSPVRLVDNKAIIYCKFNIPQSVRQEYQTPLKIDLFYGYKNHIEEKIRIHNVEN